MKFRTIKVDKDQHWCLNSLMRYSKLNATFDFAEMTGREGLSAEEAISQIQESWNGLWDRLLPIEVSLFNAYAQFVNPVNVATLHLNEQSHSDLVFFVNHYKFDMKPDVLTSQDSIDLLNKIKGILPGLMDAINNAGFVDSSPVVRNSFNSGKANTYAN